MGHKEDKFGLKAKWIANLSDGKTITSDEYSEFALIPQDDLDKVRAFRLTKGGKTYTISRIVEMVEDDEKLKVVLEGFFYHQKAAHVFVIKGKGNYLPDDLGFDEERIGFCFNSHGDAICIKLDHKDFFTQANTRMQKINELNTSLYLWQHPRDIPDYRKTMKNNYFYIKVREDKIKTIDKNINNRNYLSKNTPLSPEDRQRELRQVKNGYVRTIRGYQKENQQIQRILDNVDRCKNKRKREKIEAEKYRLDNSDIPYKMKKEQYFENLCDKSTLVDGITSAVPIRSFTTKFGDISMLPEASVEIPHLTEISEEIAINVSIGENSK